MNSSTRLEMPTAREHSVGCSTIFRRSKTGACRTPDDFDEAVVFTGDSALPEFRLTAYRTSTRGASTLSRYLSVGRHQNVEDRGLYSSDAPASTQVLDASVMLFSVTPVGVIRHL